MPYFEKCKQDILKKLLDWIIATIWAIIFNNTN